LPTLCFPRWDTKIIYDYKGLDFSPTVSFS
jgi:hypothetical protein